MRIKGVLVGAVLLGFISVACSGPPYGEAKEELEQLLRPAVRSAFAGMASAPEPLDESQQCSDPFVGPSDGLRPALTYKVGLSDLPNGGPAFIAAAQKAWEEAGFEVSEDDEEGILSRRVSSGSYGARAMVNMANEEALIGGSGPCARR